jgi:hypothetical protein
VYQFARGHPAATRILLDAVAHGGTGQIELEDLLGVHRFGESVEETMCQRLLPGITPETLDQLTTAAAARDRNEGLALAAHLHHAHPEGLGIAAAGLWEAAETARGRRAPASAPAGPAPVPAPAPPGTAPPGTVPAEIAPDLLRRLLLRRLDRRGPGHRASWQRAFTWLRTRAAGQPDGATGLPSDPGRFGRRPETLYYALAAGELATVASDLTRLLAGDIIGWLDLLHAVTRAPRRAPRPEPPGTPLAAKTPSPGALACDLVTDIDLADRPFPIVLGLVAGLWVAADPLCGSDRSALYWQIAGDYGELARHVGDRTGRLGELAHGYEERARQWRHPTPPAQPGPAARNAIGELT